MRKTCRGKTCRKKPPCEWLEQGFDDSTELAEVLSSAEGNVRGQAGAVGGRTRRAAPSPRLFHSLEERGNAHPSANAQRDYTQPDAVLLHLVQKRGGDARAAGTDSVAESNGPSLDVDLIPVPIQLSPHSQALGSERFVKFDPIHIFEPGPSLGQQLANRGGLDRYP